MKSSEGVMNMAWGKIWLIIGFLGQAAFSARFLVQWLISEYKKNSVIPVAFWWLSLIGSFLLLSYAISRRDPVFILGQSFGSIVYIRNLMLIKKNGTSKKLN